MATKEITEVGFENGTAIVVDRDGREYEGRWVVDDNSTYGKHFLHLTRKDGTMATGFGGLTLREVQEYGLREKL